MVNGLVRTSLATLGLSVAASMGAHAQQAMPMAPAGYRAPASQPAPAPAPHKHKGKTLCARCAAAQDPRMMPPGKIVACAHSKNGVCTACQAALALPGEVVMVSSAPAGEAPGRAVASSSSTPAGMAPMMAGRPPVGTPAAPFDGPAGEPTPIGVVQANFSQGAPMGMAMPAGPTAMPRPSAPGRAVAEAGAGPAPFRPKVKGSTNPKILSHLFGFSGIGAEYSEERARRKVESHAMIPYNNEGTTINELPASAVYGKR